MKSIKDAIIIQASQSPLFLGHLVGIILRLNTYFKNILLAYIYTAYNISVVA